MIAGSLFSGHGQLDYGLALAGIAHAWFCEADEWRRGILAERWPGAPVFDDVRAVDGSAPRIDLLVGGFPCRGASTAGDRAGMGNQETALWREMARVIRELRPRFVLLENVANLLAVQRGAAWGEVLGDLAEERYVVAWDCLPAAAFGAPHLRDRVFAVAAHADGSCAVGNGGLRREQDWRPDVGGGALANSGFTGREECNGSEPSESQFTTAYSRPAADSNGDPLREQPESERRGGGSAEPGIAGSPPPHSTSPDGQGTLGGWAALGRAPGLDRNRGWGNYAGAIARWEEVAGPAPEPLLRGVDARPARRVVRSRLSALGDGVQVQAGQFLGERLMDLAEQLKEAANA